MLEKRRLESDPQVCFLPVAVFLLEADRQRNRSPAERSLDQQFLWVSIHVQSRKIITIKQQNSSFFPGQHEEKDKTPDNKATHRILLRVAHFDPHDVVEQPVDGFVFVKHQHELHDERQVQRFEHLAWMERRGSVVAYLQ